MPWKYSEKVLQLFKDAVEGKPGTHMGAIDQPDGFGEHGSIVCGDALRFSFRATKDPVDPLRDEISQARFLTFGCTSAIASSEALCRLLEEQQKSPIDALKVTNQDLVDYLDGLPQEKIHCSVMGAEALQKAVIDWARKRGVDLAGYLPAITVDDEEGRLVCKCFSVTEPFLRRKIRELNLHSIEAITNATKAGGACGSCHFAAGGLHDLLTECWGEAATTSHLQPATGADTKAEEKTPYRFGRAIETAIAESIRPRLQSDGGDIELVDIKDNLVYCRLTGACADCFGAQQTLRLLVENVLKEQVDDRLKVIAL
jgi:NifU-like protein